MDLSEEERETLKQEIRAEILDELSMGLDLDVEYGDNLSSRVIKLRLNGSLVASCAFSID